MVVQNDSIKRIVKLIQQNKVALLFLDATPGAREIVILSKIVEYTERFDRVIVDLPAAVMHWVYFAFPKQP